MLIEKDETRGAHKRKQKKTNKERGKRGLAVMARANAFAETLALARHLTYNASYSQPFPASKQEITPGLACFPDAAVRITRVKRPCQARGVFNYKN